MLVSLSDVSSLLRQPGAPGCALELQWHDGTLESARLQAQSTAQSFPIVAGQPVLIDFSRSVMLQDWYETAQENYSPIGNRGSLLRVLKGQLIGTANFSRQNLSRFGDLVKKSTFEARPLVLMVGAGAKGMGTEALYGDRDIAQIAFDIYPSSITTFVADAHQIPLQDACIDAVCIQAVLEHVLDPPTVIAEIHRVLKPGGIVYAETPFMQQVHEGAYDFTRYSELGHRWLFRDFEAVERGAIGGPGLSLYWASRHFLRGLTRSKFLGDILSVPFFLFPLLDRFVPAPHVVDGANGVYFLGRKNSTPIDSGSIVTAYIGAQR